MGAFYEQAQGGDHMISEVGREALHTGIAQVFPKPFPQALYKEVLLCPEVCV